MAAALDRWLDAAAPWVVAFWEASVHAIVERSPDEIQNLGDAGRREVKAATERLIADARRHLQERLVDERPEAWPHLKPQSDAHEPEFESSFSGSGGSAFMAVTRTSDDLRAQFAPALVTLQLNDVLGEIAAPFAGHGIDLEGFSPAGAIRGWTLEHGRHPPDWSESMMESMAEYAELHIAYVHALIARDAAIVHRNQARASDLWNRA